jgi:predicted dithiol-disulfide oxidoreductase (DUF899 family)
MTDHSVVSREEWASAREKLLAREKEHTRLGDEVARQRRELPWVRVEKWASSYESDFSVELGFSGSLERTREWVEPMVDQLPPVAARNARAVGTDLVSYLAEGFGFSAFALEDGVVYQTHSTTGRGVEFLMSYYAILDRAPKGRDEDDGFQLWIRRHYGYGTTHDRAETVAIDAGAGL